MKRLIRLQEVDLAIRDYQAKTDAFPGKSKALDEKLANALAGVEQAKEAIRKSQHDRKEHESKVADLETKISKYRDQLMSVKTNEEYKAMTKEIEFSRQAIEKEEDQILEILEQADQLAADLKAAETTLAEDERKVATERSELEEHNARDQQTLEAYIAERKELTGQIDPDTVEQYERVRKVRNGVAVAQASDETCQVCNVRMRPQRFQEVRQNQAIITCDSCNRILYDPENMDHPFEVA